MELEELNKSQIVLLTLLVSFVTSIATGIVTVSLMEQAPTDVTRVIQKTVERTVEKVAPPEIQTKIITREKTIVVSDADLIANAVELNTPSVVRIYAIDEEDPTLIALGIVISSAGVVATDAANIDADASYSVVASSATYDANVLRIDEEKNIALLELSDTGMVPRPASISTAKTKLGSAAILLSGAEKTTIAQGLVTDLDAGAFGTNLQNASIVSGSILISIDGNVLGMSTASSREYGGNWFIPARGILSLLKAPAKDTQSEESVSSATSTDSTQQAAAAGALEGEEGSASTTQ